MARLASGRSARGESIDLTICSVSFRSAAYLELNGSLAERLNPGASFQWIVADNSPEPPDAMAVDRSDRFRVILGPPFVARVHGSASYHHAAGMALTLPLVSTRFALFVDPDFFLVRRHWIRDVLEHMVRRELSFFGVPWHPRWHLKDRYFPCVHCLFVDLARVPIETLDFEPEYPEVPGYARGRVEQILVPRRFEKRAPGPLRRLLRRLTRVIDPLDLRNRRFIGTSRDVSHHIFRRYHADPQHRSECTVPVYRPDRSAWAAAIERCLPDRLCYVPSRPASFVADGFLPLDDAIAGWEEFLWQDAPFGFHVRNYGKRGDAKAEAARVARFLDSIMERDA